MIAHIDPIIYLNFSNLCNKISSHLIFECFRFGMLMRCCSLNVHCHSSFFHGNWYYFHNGNADISLICIAATFLTFSQMIMCYTCVCVAEQSPYMRIICINIIIIFAVNNDNNNNLTSLMHLTNSFRIESSFFSPYFGSYEQKLTRQNRPWFGL